MLLKRDAGGEIMEEHESEPVIEVLVLPVGMGTVKGEVLRTKPVPELGADEIGTPSHVVIPAGLSEIGTDPVEGERKELQAGFPERLRTAASRAKPEDEIVFSLHGPIIPDILRALCRIWHDYSGGMNVV